MNTTTSFYVDEFPLLLPASPPPNIYTQYHILNLYTRALNSQHKSPLAAAASQPVSRQWRAMLSSEPRA